MFICWKRRAARESALLYAWLLPAPRKGAECALHHQA
jgi:hypothetical protein